MTTLGANQSPTKSRFRLSSLVGHRALAIAFILLALTFGGSSRADVFSPTILRLAAIPLLCVAIWRLTEHGFDRGAIWPSLTLAALAVVALVQLVPLPPSIWTRLPGHELATETYRTIGMSAPWLPASMVPDATWNSLFSLIPPSAMFMATLTLDAAGRRSLLTAVLFVAVLAVILGMFQILGGPDSTLRPYAITNPDSAVGFFANRNHQASFLLVSVPVAAWWTMLGNPNGNSKISAAHIVGLALVAVLVVGMVITRSRTAVVLGLASVMLSVLLVYRTGASERRGRRGLLFGAVAGVAIALIAVFSIGPTLDRFTNAPAQERWSLTPTLERIALDYSPLGSGLGSFERVYQQYERVEQLGPSYWNHAHDDFMEIWIDTGWFGVLMVASGVFWFLTRSLDLWRDGRPGEAWRDLGRVGTIVIALLALHSLGDYPLRTPALATLFALCCALMVAPRGPADRPTPPRPAARRA